MKDRRRRRREYRPFSTLNFDVGLLTTVAAYFSASFRRAERSMAARYSLPAGIIYAERRCATY